MANSGTVDLVEEDDDDEFERDLKKAIAASLMTKGQLGDIDAGDDIEKALALSMHTFKAEKQHKAEEQPAVGQLVRSQQLHHPARAQHPSASSRKRDNSASADILAAASQEQAAAGWNKRQRNTCSHASASNQVSQCGECNSGKDDQDTGSSRQQQYLQSKQQQHSLQQQEQEPQQEQQQPLPQKFGGDSELAAAAAILLVTLSQSSGLQAAAAQSQTAAVPLASMSHMGLRKGQQQQTGPAGVGELRRISGTQHLPDLQIAAVEQQQQQQQPQSYYQQHAPRLDCTIDDDVEACDWDDITPDLSLLPTDVPPHTKSGPGSGQEAVQPQQRAAPPLNASQQSHQQQQLQIPPSEVSHVSRRLIYQLHDRVHWLDPYSRCAFSGVVVTVDSCEGAGHLGRRYLLDVDAPVRYVEASCEQLLPRVEAGDAVWCKPNMALQAAWSAQTAQTVVQQQQLQQLLAQRPGSDDRWLCSPWIQGCVVGACVHHDPGCAAVPVVEVSLPCGGRCWFPLSALQLVRETGESSNMAALKGQRPSALPQQQLVDDDTVPIASASVAAADSGAHSHSGGVSEVAREHVGGHTVAAPPTLTVHQQQQPLDYTSAESGRGAQPADHAVAKPQQPVLQCLLVHAPLPPAAVPQVLCGVQEHEEQQQPQQVKACDQQCGLSGACRGVLSGPRCSHGVLMQQQCGTESRLPKSAAGWQQQQGQHSHEPEDV